MLNVDFLTLTKQFIIRNFILCAVGTAELTRTFFDTLN